MFYAYIPKYEHEYDYKCLYVQIFIILVVRSHMFKL